MFFQRGDPWVLKLYLKKIKNQRKKLRKIHLLKHTFLLLRGDPLVLTLYFLKNQKSKKKT